MCVYGEIAVEGVAVGLERLKDGVVDGISGIVKDPLTGAQNEGVSGFVKGVGKGLLGAVTKPVIGVVDVGSSILRGKYLLLFWFVFCCSDTITIIIIIFK